MDKHLIPATVAERQGPSGALVPAARTGLTVAQATAAGLLPATIPPDEAGCRALVTPEMREMFGDHVVIQNISDCAFKVWQEHTARMRDATAAESTRRSDPRNFAAHVTPSVNALTRFQLQEESAMRALVAQYLLTFARLYGGTAEIALESWADGVKRGGGNFNEEFKQLYYHVKDVLDPEYATQFRYVCPVDNVAMQALSFLDYARTFGLDLHTKGEWTKVHLYRNKERTKLVVESATTVGSLETMTHAMIEPHVLLMAKEERLQIVSLVKDWQFQKTERNTMAFHRTDTLAVLDTKSIYAVLLRECTVYQPPDRRWYDAARGHHELKDDFKAAFKLVNGREMDNSDFRKLYADTGAFERRIHGVRYVCGVKLRR